MTVILTNDDGIHAAGLAALLDVAGRRDSVVVVAPHAEQSGVSHRVTDKGAMQLRQVAEHQHALAGTPADCARVGLLHLAPTADWLLSGINAGGNLGSDIYMSGTVAAAREAALLGIRAIAFSQYRQGLGTPWDWDRAMRWTERVLNTLLELPLGPGEFWNVNFPDPEEPSTDPELVFCPVDPGHHAVRYEHSAEGLVYRGKYQQRNRQPGCDVDVCFSGHIAITRVGPSSCPG